MIEFRFLDVCASLAEGALVTDFMNRSLGWRTDRMRILKSFVCIFLLSAISYCVPVLVDVKWLAIVLMLVVSFAYARLHLQGNLFQQAMTAIVGCTLMLVVNICTLRVIGLMFDMTFESILIDLGPIHLKLVLSAKLVYFSVTRLILRFRRRDENELFPMEWIAILSILLVTLSMGCMLFEVMWMQDYGDAVLTTFAVCMVLINVLTYILVRRLSSAHRKKTEIALLELQISEQKSRMEEINGMYREILQIRHDIRKSVGAAAALIHQGKCEEAAEYLSALSGDRLGSIKEYVVLRSDVVSALINAKLSQCRREEIEIDVSLSDCIEGLPEVDVSILLSNLFDNAIEACRLVSGKKYLSLRMEQQKGYVRILMKNSATCAEENSNPSLQTTKKDKTNHGFGVKTIQEISVKHRGMCDFQRKKNEFISDIWLQPMQNNTLQA